jgi:hypothetical protein
LFKNPGFASSFPVKIPEFAAVLKTSLSALGPARESGICLEKNL